MAGHFILERNQLLIGSGALALNEVFEVFLDHGVEFSVRFFRASVHAGQSAQVFAFAGGHFPHQAGVVGLSEHFAFFIQFDQTLRIAIGKSGCDRRVLSGLQDDIGRHSYQLYGAWWPAANAALEREMRAVRVILVIRSFFMDCLLMVLRVESG